MPPKRSAFHQDVAEALIEADAINLEAIGDVYRKFSRRAFLEGEDLVHIINRKSMWACGWPGPELQIAHELAEGPSA